MQKNKQKLLSCSSRNSASATSVHPVSLETFPRRGSAHPPARWPACATDMAAKPIGHGARHAISPRLEHRGAFVRNYLRPDNATEVAVATADATVETMRMEHLRTALTAAMLRGRGGLFLEFGVQRGDALNFLASLNRSIFWHGFDSFTGMPPDDKRDEERARRKPVSWRKGGYSLQGRMPKVAKNVMLHPGFFNVSVPFWMDAVKRFGFQGNPNPFVSFAHLDADLYSSTIDVLEAMASKCLLREGTVLSFDELFGHPSVKQLEWRALLDASHRWCFRFRFVSFMLHPTSKYGRAAVRLYLPRARCDQASQSYHTECIVGHGWCWAPGLRGRT